MKKNLFQIILFFLLVILFLPNISSAVTAVTITSILTNVGNIVTTVAVILIVILWIITGLLFLTALGAPDKLGVARKALFAAVIGTVIVMLAYFAKDIIGNAIFNGQ